MGSICYSTITRRTLIASKFSLSPKNLSIFSLTESWYLDVTFYECPQLFYQLIILDEEIVEPSSDSNWHFPLVYFLATRKNAATYETTLTLLILHYPQSRLRDGSSLNYPLNLPLQNYGWMFLPLHRRCIPKPCPA